MEPVRSPALADLARLVVLEDRRDVLLVPDVLTVPLDPLPPGDRAVPMQVVPVPDVESEGNAVALGEALRRRYAERGPLSFVFGVCTVSPGRPR